MNERENSESQQTDREFQKEIIRRIGETKNYCQEVTITKVKSECPYGHKEGEVYRVNDINSGGLCGTLYRDIHDLVLTTYYGAQIPWEKESGYFSGSCPEMGKVDVDVNKVKDERFKALREIPPYRDMTGKGFPLLDKFRIFVEIVDIARHCSWGHKVGQRFEVDPFNVGQACARLYRQAYYAINILLSEKKVHWQVEENKLQMTCPDTHNQTSFVLIREKR